jgi:hypothetical protein
MKKITFVMVALLIWVTGLSQTPEGQWKMAPVAGAFEVGPSQGSGAFFSSGLDQVTIRACYFDDLFVFNTDGSFENQDQGVTWLEGWQGVNPEQCGPSVAPHDNSNPATWVYDEGAGTLTLNGTGAYVGLPKAVNGGELPNVAVPASRTYIVSAITGASMTLDIQVGGAWWRFRLLKDAPPTCDDGIQNGEETGVDCGGPDCAPCAVATVDGEWKMAPVAGAFEVGPSQGSGAFFSSGTDQVTIRDCYFDDLFVFNTDGSFENQDQGVTWLEGWQGVNPEQCGPSVAPHDNSNPATWVYDEGAGTLTLNGTGAYIGLPKAVNGGELPGVAVPASRTYLVSALTASSMTVDIEVGGGAWWRFRLQKEAAPTCNDGIQNGDEEGVDCGGSSCAPCVDPGDLTQLIGNGSFETGDFTDWEVAGSGITVVSTNPSEGNFAAHINNTTAASSSSIKSANRGIGIVNPGDELTIRFDIRGTTAAGGILFVELLSEFAGGGASQQFLGGGPLFPNADPNVWTPYEFTVNAGGNVAGGVSLLFNAVTGGDSGSISSIFIDNVSMINNDEQLSVGDVTSNITLSVFPNPSNGNWTISSVNNQNLTSVVIYDILGKQVISLKPNNTEAVIDASNLKDGLYLAQISTVNGSQTVKLIKN